MTAWYANSSLACAAWLSYSNVARQQKYKKTPQLIFPAVREADLRMEQSLSFLLQNSYLLSVTNCYALLYGTSSSEPHAAKKGARRLGALARIYFGNQLPLLLFAPSVRTRPIAYHVFWETAKSEGFSCGLLCSPKMLLRLWWKKTDSLCFDRWIVPYGRGRYGVKCLSLPSFYHCSSYTGLSNRAVHDQNAPSYPK